MNRWGNENDMTPFLPGLGADAFEWPSGCRCDDDRGRDHGDHHEIACPRFCACDAPGKTTPGYAEPYVCAYHKAMAVYEKHAAMAAADAVKTTLSSFGIKDPEKYIKPLTAEESVS